MFLFCEYFIIHSVTDGHLSSFGLNNVAVKVLEHVFWCTYACISDRYISEWNMCKNGIAGSQGMNAFQYSRIYVYIFDILICLHGIC